MELAPHLLIMLVGAIAVVAFLYASVGHAGASGYIAVLAFFPFAAPEIKGMALTLNILVAAIGAWQFWCAGHFRWPLFWPFALMSMPAAYLGGCIHLSPMVYKPLLGVVLLYSAARFYVRQGDPANPVPPKRPVALGTGASLGFLAGLTGTGGGIFLTPLMLLAGWAHTRQVAAVSVVFILVNSCAGLAGHLWSGQSMPPKVVWLLAIAAVIGGALGSYGGSKKFRLRAIHVLLALVLAIAGGKLVWEGIGLMVA